MSEPPVDGGVEIERPDEVANAEAESAGGEGPPSKMLTGVALLLVLFVLYPTGAALVSSHRDQPDVVLLWTCIAVFADILALWLLNEVKLIVFRNSWTAKAIWSACLVSLLATGGKMFASRMLGNPYPYMGRWVATMTENYAGGTNGEWRRIADFDLTIAYDAANGYYVGTSAPVERSPGEIDTVYWLEVRRFAPSDKAILTMTWHSTRTTDNTYGLVVTELDAGRAVEASLSVRPEESPAGGDGGHVQSATLTLRRRN